jgi:hypothetical protein
VKLAGEKSRVEIGPVAEPDENACAKYDVACGQYRAMLADLMEGFGEIAKL